MSSTLSYLRFDTLDPIFPSDKRRQKEADVGAHVFECFPARPAVGRPCVVRREPKFETWPRQSQRGQPDCAANGGSRPTGTRLRDSAGSRTPIGSVPPALAERNHLGPAQHPGALLLQDELVAREGAARLRHEHGDRDRESELAAKIQMQGVEIARHVLEQRRRRPGLASLVILS